MDKQHSYQTHINWTGNKGSGTSAYRAYSRNYSLNILGKKEIACSSDTPFMGDPALHNPEDMFLAALSSCHMLWYLHLCADAGIIVLAYEDQARGTLSINELGKGKFSEVILQPLVTVAEASMINTALSLHNKAHEYCFIANSSSVKISHQPRCICNEG